jgi:hypothetical protein
MGTRAFMKTGLAMVALLGLVACAKKEERSLDQRVRALDVYLAKGGTPEPADVISPILTQRALTEFAKRRPDATLKESKLTFAAATVAKFSVVYSTPGNAKPRTQTIEFIYGRETWNMFWMPDAAR